MTLVDWHHRSGQKMEKPGHPLLKRALHRVPVPPSESPWGDLSSSHTGRYEGGEEGTGTCTEGRFFTGLTRCVQEVWSRTGQGKPDSAPSLTRALLQVGVTSLAEWTLQTKGRYSCGNRAAAGSLTR